MMKASELHNMLTGAGASDSEANGIVISRIEKGECEDDDFSESVEKAMSDEVATIEKAAEAIQRTLALDDDVIQKAGDYDMDDDDDDDDDDDEEEEETEKAFSSDYDMVALVSKGADQIVDIVEHNHEVLAKGYLALNDVIKSYDRRSRSLENKLDIILKALGEPIAPRSVVSDVEVIEAPGEALSKGNVTTVDVIQKALELVRVSDDRTRSHELSHAVAMLESGADPTHIATTYNIH